MLFVLYNGKNLDEIGDCNYVLVLLFINLLGNYNVFLGYCEDLMKLCDYRSENYKIKVGLNGV